MAEFVYVLCAALSLACTYLLLRARSRNGLPLLFWSAICFVGFAINNLLLLADLVFNSDFDFSVWRNLSGLVGCGFLLYGLLWTEMPGLIDGVR